MLKRFSNPTTAVVERLRPNTPGSEAFRSRADARTTVIVEGKPDEHWRPIPVTRLPKDAKVEFSVNYKGCRRYSAGKAFGLRTNRVTGGDDSRGLPSPMGTKGWGAEYRSDRNHRLNIK